MSDRRNRPQNRWGCKPTEDVCVAHDRPLECPHGCKEAAEHKCKYKEQPGYDFTHDSGCDTVVGLRCNCIAGQAQQFKDEQKAARRKRELPMTTDLCLHILRNPYGWADDKQREARLFAADLIEAKRQCISLVPSKEDR